MTSVIFSLYGVSYYLNKVDGILNSGHAVQRGIQLKQVIDYVLCSLLSQGKSIRFFQQTMAYQNCFVDWL